MPEAHAQSFAAVVAEQAKGAPDRPWLEAARSDRVLDRAALAMTAEGWRASGLAGRRVGLVAEDPVAFGAIFVSLVAAGATVVPLDASAPPDAVRTLLAASLAEVVVVLEDGSAPDGAEQVIRASATTLLPVGPSSVTGPPTGPVPQGDGGCLLFSSGSTGPRKAVLLTQAQLLHVARAVARTHELGPDDRGYNPLPLVHVNGEVVGLLAPLVSGGTVVLDGRFHRTAFWELIRHRSVTWVNAVPAIIAILAQEPPGPAAPPGLRFVRTASAPLPRPVLSRFEERYGVPVIESYGMTEAASQITVNPLRDRRPGSVGQPADVELRVLAEGGAAAAVGEVGRVHIRGAGVIRRYENGVGEERFDTDGWLDTGDLGAQDGDGFLTLSGRDTDVINRSGEKIFPREVEDVLLGDPGIREALVVARPDPVLGEVPVAYVVAVADAPPDLVDQLAARCVTALPTQHRPVEIRLLDDLPRGPTGKPVRRLLAEDRR